MVEFKKYSSLDNHHKERAVNTARALAGNVPWLATEKLHGCNFSLWTDGTDVSPAKRSGWIQSTGKFYRCTEVVEAHVPKVKNLFNDLKQTLGKVGITLTHIAVFGELVGPGVQREVFYGDEKNFYAFDILAFAEGAEEPWFLDFDAVVYNCESHEIETVPVVGTYGSLDQALEEANEFDSIVAGKEDNMTEGLVLRPSTERKTKTGHRLLIKSKNLKFSERKQNVAAKKVKVLTPEAQAEWGMFATYLTDNRLSNVLSKFEEGELDFGKTMQAFVSDAMTEFTDEVGELDNWEHYRKWANAEAAKLVRQRLFS